MRKEEMTGKEYKEKNNEEIIKLTEKELKNIYGESGGKNER